MESHEGTSYVGVGFDLLTYLETAHVGKHHVEHNQVGVSLGDRFQRIFPCGSLYNIVAARSQDCRREREDMQVIVNNQYFCLITHAIGTCNQGIFSDETA